MIEITRIDTDELRYGTEIRITFYVEDEDREYILNAIKERKIKDLLSKKVEQ